MALRRQNLSPTANLLRNSRLFSLPNPLPRPPVAEAYGANTPKASDTATLPFPTHQAIATTKSSLARGDWGLKRPLPARSRIVQTSNPVVKVTQLDTIEHVTDYDSAADHVRTRQKFEELGIPMMKGMAAMRESVSSLPPDGAFESRSDLTSYEGDEGLDQAGLILETIKQSVKVNAQEREKAWKAKKQDPNASPAPFIPYSLPQVDVSRHSVRRWKHEGPWLPGMSADEFTEYITKEISARRKEFSQYLKQYVKNEIYILRQNAARSSEALPLDAAEAEAHLAEEEKKWSNISPEDIKAGIRALRREAATDPLTSRLVQRLIVPFLRLPTIKLKNTSYSQHATRNDFEQYRFDDDTAPLSTHPSAGLGYLRTNAVLTNHPILGPQSERAPVKARVVQPRQTASYTEPYARLGVAGFVTNDSERSTGGGATKWSYLSRRGGQNVDSIDIDSVGGTKIDILPRFASVTNDGRIHIKVARSVGAEVNVARGELDDRPPARQQDSIDVGEA
ncbi:hypothetical protein K458DRAFT_442732 [Lentithecium fluviatile CBS 122367]|uniref:Uncharacterized protein n=1 Tax=Lentithecium fluviatile CBS 122367 TaxID=1168545 RepID=A0A6G1J245_9PLEO|nr:hypothetical protein K458DRAFT_442732 [Lentithecium fluviatile CBS 122367]